MALDVNVGMFLDDEFDGYCAELHERRILSRLGRTASMFWPAWTCRHSAR